MRCICLAAGVLVLEALALPVSAQNPVHWTDGPPTRSGAAITAHLSGAIDAGWHVYALTQGPGGPIAMRITLAAGQPFALAGDIVGPKPRSEHDANFDLTVDEYEKAMAFAIPLRATPGERAGAASATLRIRYQACTARFCLPPRTDAVIVPVQPAKQ